MSTVIKDLGAVSAYAYAVEKGYTGTEAEFAELMASYAEVGQTATDAAESALNSKTAAQTAATTATNKASEATTAAQTATTKAGEAQTSAQTASSKASEASQSASQASGYAQTAETAKTDAQTAKTQAETARDEAVTAKTAAETAQGKAEDAQAAAESVAESIPSDYSQLSEDVSDLKEDLSEISEAISGEPYPSQQTMLDYSVSPFVVDSGVTVYDGKVLNNSGNIANSSGSMRYEFAVSEGDSFSVSGRLGNFAVVLFAGTTKAKIYLIADVGAEITASGIGTYTQASKSFSGWNLIIPEYDEDAFPYHVDRIGITAATYSTTPGSNTTPICTKNIEVSGLIRSQDLADEIEELQTDKVYKVTPITDFPVYLKNIIAYKPTGAFSKPYICLSTDDGREGLIHQTIEMVVNEAHVPVTFCIHSHSDIFYAQKRKKYTLAEVSSSIGGAITNYGCELALHDNRLWADKDATHKTTYTEKTLAEYVANEQAFFANPYEIDTETSFGVSWTLKSASAPEHATDQIVCGIMGGTFGVLRSGDTSSGMIKNIYDYKCIGARTNLYCLPCKNFNSSMYNTLQKCKDAVDYAVANNLVLPIFWHEAIMEDATTESTSNEHISDAQIADLLLPMIEYAKSKGVEFVTLSQIQNLT